MARLRAQAEQVRARIDRFNDDIADLVEEYNEHDEALGRTRVAMHQTARRLGQAQVRLEAARRQLRRRARAVYIWERDPFSRYGQLLGVRGLHEVAAAHGYQSWVMNADERAVARVTLARRSLVTLSQRLGAQHGLQLDLLGRLGRERAAIERQLHQQRSYLGRLTDQIRRAAEQAERGEELRRHHVVVHQLAAEQRRWQHYAERHAGRRHAPRRGRAAGRATSWVGRSAARWALRQVGKPYRWGAVGPRAFDCSGLTMRAYQTAGVALPRTSRAQFNSGRRLNGYGDMRPGDLLFFGRSWRSINHVGMYIGNGRMVHAPYSGARVRVASIARRNFVGAARPTA